MGDGVSVSEGKGKDGKYLLRLIKPKFMMGNLRITPLSILTLAALTPRDRFDVELMDGSVEKVLILPADIVGITVNTLEAVEAYRIADLYRAAGVTVVLGGIHPSFMPEEAAEHADSVVIGEAEGIWAGVLDDFAAGKLKDIYRADDRPDMSRFPVLDYSILKLDRYLFGAVQTTRGCPMDCDFCSVIAFNGRGQRHRPVGDVVREIKGLAKARGGDAGRVFIVDDNLTADRAYAKELFSALEPLDIEWVAQFPTDIADDAELLDLACRSGLRVAIIGFESVNQVSLAGVRKANIVKRYGRLVRALKDRKILILGMFVLGLDGDDPSVFRRTLRFCDWAGMHLAFFHQLTPLPGTRLFDEIEKSGRLLTRDWSAFDRVVFRPSGMSARELYSGILFSYRRFYSVKNIVRNLWRAGDYGVSFRGRMVLLGLYSAFFLKKRIMSVQHFFSGFLMGKD